MPKLQMHKRILINNIKRVGVPKIWSTLFCCGSTLHYIFIIKVIDLKTAEWGSVPIDPEEENLRVSGTPI